MLKAVNGRKYISEEVVNNMLYRSRVLGVTGSELYGWCYPIYGERIFQVYTEDKLLDDYCTPLRHLFYLPDYNLSIGFDRDMMPSPERVICDFIKYPERLGTSIYIGEALEGYLEDNKDFSKIYNMLGLLNIPRENFEQYFRFIGVGHDD